MDYLPIFLDIKQQSCLVVGGGGVALRRASLLQRAGATLRVVAPEINTELQALVQTSGGTCHERVFEPEDVAGASVVIAATDQREVNRQVSEVARQSGIPINVVDDPALCSFIMPALVDRSPILVAITSGAQSPVLTRFLRTHIESLLPASYGQLATLVGKFRGQVKQAFQSINQRRRFWESVLQGPIAEMVFSGKQETAEQLLQERLTEADKDAPAGEVYLVGGGPGDPDLLTFRALRLMQQADVVFYDRLVSPQVLDLVRRDAEKIYVGKARSDHAVPQEGINRLLVKYAHKGHRVLRLKGGDPFIFGRGGEEIEELAQEQIPFQVVPGITAASGCSSYAGIPLTHRDHAQSVRFVTGHLKEGSPDLNWAELVDSRQTLVFYMGLVGLPLICERLMAHGRGPDTPIALVQQGTTPQQKVFVGTLATMAATVAAESIKPPTLIIVGEVVQLHEKLAWFNPGQ